MGIKQFSNPTSGYVNKFLRGINFDSTGTGPSAAPVSGPDGNSGISATGGQISEFTAPTGEVYKTHQFTSSGSFVISSVSGDGKVDWLVIGGGGAGSTECSGGGGAGGYRTSLPEGPGGPSPTAETQLTLSAATYPIVIGAGGYGAGNAPGNGTGTYGGAGGEAGQNGSSGGNSGQSGGGGGWGAAGGRGYRGAFTSVQCQGGAAGKAIEDSGNSYTLINSGTIYGATT